MSARLLLQPCREALGRGLKVQEPLIEQAIIEARGMRRDDLAEVLAFGIWLYLSYGATVKARRLATEFWNISWLTRRSFEIGVLKAMVKPGSRLLRFADLLASRSINEANGEPGGFVAVPSLIAVRAAVSLLRKKVTAGLALSEATIDPDHFDFETMRLLAEALAVVHKTGHLTTGKIRKHLRLFKYIQTHQELLCSPQLWEFSRAIGEVSEQRTPCSTKHEKR